MKIFVSIASYQDPILPYTIESIIENSTYKKDLVLGIFDQSLDHLDVFKEWGKYGPEIRYKTCEPKESLGACWARSKIQTELFDGEDIFMQIDSHTQFDKDWDADLLNKYENCFNWFSKPLITGYPRPLDVIPPQGGFFNTSENLILRKKYSEEELTHVMVFDKGIDNAGEGNIHATAKDIPKPPAYYKAYALSGGFIFTEGEWVNKVPYDPLIYFIGEETTLALRSYTHGYDLVHVPSTPLYHWYNGENLELKRELHWETEEHKQRLKEINEKAHSRVNDVLLGKVKDKYGFGDVRTPKQYAELSGIDYVNNTVQLDAAKGNRMVGYNLEEDFE